MTVHIAQWTCTKKPALLRALLLQLSVVAAVVSTVMTTVMSASEAKSDAGSTAVVVRLWGIVSLRSIVAVAPTVRANVSMA